MQDNANDLIAALNNHQVTDDQGQVVEETTSPETPITQEDKPIEEVTDSAEKSTEETPSAPKAEEDSEETEHAVDDQGKRYVPEGRFNEIYGGKKQAERERDAAKAEAEALRALLGTTPTRSEPAKDIKPASKEDRLEVELLKVTLPQFNQDSDQYSPTLDSLGAEIYEANKSKGMTRIDAAKKAIKLAKELAQKEVDIQTEARTVKSNQSDQGIATRVTSRQPTKVDTDKMSDKELEAHLRSTGQW